MVHCSAIYGEIFSHRAQGNHDESGARIHEALKGVPEEVPIITPCCASETDLLRVHTSSHIRMIREFSSHGGLYYIDHNTYIDRETFSMASYAAGAAIEAVHRSIDGESCFAYCPASRTSSLSLNVQWVFVFLTMRQLLLRWHWIGWIKSRSSTGISTTGTAHRRFSFQMKGCSFVRCTREISFLTRLGG